MADKATITHDPSWSVMSLAEVTTKIGSGATPRGGSDAYLPTRTTYALVRSQNVFDRRFDRDGLAFISDEQADSLRGVILQPGDVLLNITGDGVTFGRACLVPSDILPACVNQHVSIIRVDPRRAHPGYVLSFLTHPEVKSYIESFNAGGSRRAITKGHIESFRVPLPPLPEQHAIAHILGTLDDKIDLNRRMNETLEAMARALFKSWFTDFDPVRRNADRRRNQPSPAASRHPLPKVEGSRSGNGRTASLHHLPTGQGQARMLSFPSTSGRGGGGEGVVDGAAFDHLFPDSFEDSELGEIPKGWRVAALDEVAVFLNGLALQKYPPRGHDDLPVIKIAELRQGHSGGCDWANSTVGDEYVVDDGDVLFSWSGSLLVKIWCGGKGALNQHLFKVTSTDFPEWFYFMWTRHHLPDFQAIASGKATTMGHIQRHHLSGAKVLVPPADLLDAMDGVFAPLITRYVTGQVESRTLAALRDALLPKLISGEVRVKDAERIAGRALA